MQGGGDVPCLTPAKKLDGFYLGGKKQLRKMS